MSTAQPTVARVSLREIATLRDRGVRRLVFLIGGADGPRAGAPGPANGKLAFGPQTWPHAMARAMLADRFIGVTILPDHPTIATDADPRPALPLTLTVSLATLVIGAVAIAATGERLARLNTAETELSVEAGPQHEPARPPAVGAEQLKRDPPPALLVSPRDAKDAVRAAILVKP